MKALLVALALGLPATAFAQAAIVGSVKDVSGTPLADVSVEVASPALIERRRAALTDAAGRYKIEDLRPGRYLVQFRLQGWRPSFVADVELAGSQTATVNTALAPLALTESVVVTADAMPLDVRSTTRQVTLSGETVQTLPTARGYNALIGLVPGVVTNVNDTVTGTATTSFPIHGGRANEGRLLLDGLTVGSPPSGNSAPSYVIDIGSAQDVTFVTAGGLGESETGGVVINIVSRNGGNALRGSIFASGTGAGLHSDNLTPALQQRGVAAATPLSKLYDVAGTLGGPIREDRAWFFLTAHTGGSRRDSAVVYANLNAGNAARWLYAPDLSRRSYSDRTFENASTRLTWQVSPRHKVTAFWDAQSLCRTCSGATPGLSEPQQVSPEAVGVLGRPLHVAQASWSSPVSPRLLLEAGFAATHFGVGNFERDPNPTRGLIRVVEQCASGCAANGNIPGLAYRSQDFSAAHTGSYLLKGSMVYVTGSHSLKVGYQRTLMTDDRTWMTNDQHLTYRFDNGVPNQLTQSISPWVNDARAAWEGLFAQQEWTRARVTLHGAVRFDRAWSWFPVQQQGPSRFLPTAIVIPETRGVDSYKNVTARMGVAYDLFGTGATTVKVTVGEYLEGVGIAGTYANTNPTLRMPQTTTTFGTAGVTRAWTDANRNFTPDCDLLNPDAQDLRSGGGDLCGVLSNRRFGQNVLTNAFDVGLLNGWGVRPSDWNVSAMFQQRIGARSSLDITYIRRAFRGFSVVDNLALDDSDLTRFSLTAPLDPRLPGGGGYVVSDLYDVVPEKAGQVMNLVTGSDRYGRWTQRFNGLDVGVNLRTTMGLTLIGGTSTGQTVADNCEVRARLPELATTTVGTSPFGAGLQASPVTPASPYCHVAGGILTQLRGLSSYVVPKVGVQVAAVYQSRPGPMLGANYSAPNAEVAASLGRNLSGNASNITVNLIRPGTLHGDRINVLDLRVAKLLTFRRSRTALGVDIYNALNSSAALTYNSAFVPGGTWLQPLTILTPRFLKLTAEIEF
jgi:hypothetical protein